MSKRDNSLQAPTTARHMNEALSRKALCSTGIWKDLTHHINVKAVWRSQKRQVYIDEGRIHYNLQYLTGYGRSCRHEVKYLNSDTSTTLRLAGNILEEIDTFVLVLPQPSTRTIFSQHSSSPRHRS